MGEEFWKTEDDPHPASSLAFRMSSRQVTCRMYRE